MGNGHNQRIKEKVKDAMILWGKLEDTNQTKKLTRLIGSFSMPTKDTEESFDYETGMSCENDSVQ